MMNKKIANATPLMDALNSMFGTTAKPAMKIRSTMPSGPLKDMGKFLAKVAKKECAMIVDSFGNEYTFTIAAEQYATMMKIATGKQFNTKRIEAGRKITTLEFTTNQVAWGIIGAYQLGHISAEQINEQFRIEDDLLYTSTGRVNDQRMAKRDVLYEVLEFIESNK